MSCQKCDFKTKCLEILMSHMTKKHKQCVKCEKTFLLQDDLLTHLYSEHGENVQCSICDYKAYPEYEIVYHKMTEHGHCDKCLGQNSTHLQFDHGSRIQEMSNLDRFDLETEKGVRCRNFSENSFADYDEPIHIETLDDSSDEENTTPENSENLEKDSSMKKTAGISVTNSGKTHLSFFHFYF